MRNFVLFYALAVLSLHFPAHAAPSGGTLINHLSSLLIRKLSNTKTSQSDGNVVQFENGYVVETLAERNDIGVIPYTIRVSDEDELFAIDAINSNIVRITPPLSQYSRGRLVAGSFLGRTGHVDGKPSDARFHYPKGIALDDKGNVYVADTQNMAIRKIGDAGVTTIAGGKSNVAGYRDGPGEDAKFSNDFDVVYIRPTCSLLVIDRGNAALRQIFLNQEDCNYQSSSISLTDILSVVGAVIVGYGASMLQQGLGSSFFSKMKPSERDFKGKASSDKSKSTLERTKEETGWPLFRQVVDLLKISLEEFTCSILKFMPSNFRLDGTRRGLTPLKDRLWMPEDELEPLLIKRQSALAPPLTETRQIHLTSAAEKYSETKIAKVKSSTPKDPSLPSKHRSSKRQEYAEFYGSSEIPAPTKSKIQKQRSRHRRREKSEEVSGAGAEQKPLEMRAADYSNTKYDQYNYNMMRTKYVSEDTSRFNPH